MTTIHPTLEQLIRLQYDGRRVSLLPRQPAASLLSGRHASRLRGRGLAFEELRDYRPGDDIRMMDWKATARLRKPHVRVYTEERERPVLLVVDQRTTMFFGSARTTKAAVAVEFAALTAWAALHAGDRVGGIVCEDEALHEVRPQRSRSNVLRLCQEMVDANGRLSARGEQHSSQFNAALRRAVERAKHDYLVILATDYAGADEETQRLVTRLAAHNDVIAALVYDPLGAQFPNLGETMKATDGQMTWDVPKDANFTARFEEVFRQHCQEIRETLRSLRVPVLPLCTHDEVPAQVLRALGVQA